jgi:hypothetical protein
MSDFAASLGIPECETGCEVAVLGDLRSWPLGTGVVPAVPDRPAKRSNSWAAASVLKAQKPVASCISGMGDKARSVVVVPGSAASLCALCSSVMARACRRPAADDHARSLSPNGSRDASGCTGDRAGVLVTPRPEPIARRAERESGGRRPIAQAQWGGGTIHPIKSALRPDRMPAAQHTLCLIRVKPAAGVTGAICQQHRAGRREVRGDRHSRCCYAARRALADDVQDAAAVPCRDMGPSRRSGSPAGERSE